MSTNNQNRILLVDDNQIFRQALAQRLQTAGYQVVTEESGERAFLSVRNWQRPIDWLYTRAALPRMVDGWILADAYHEVYAHRPVVISAAEMRASARDIILKQPSPAEVMNALRSLIEGELTMLSGAEADLREAKRAA
jgi:DNA-binding NarL/FixJ family response regulator